MSYPTYKQGPKAGQPLPGYGPPAIPGLTIPASSSALVNPWKSSVNMPGGVGGSASVPPSRIVNAMADSKADREAMVGGQGTVVPLIYGRARVGGIICQEPRTVGNELHLVVAVCEGEIEEIEQVLINDRAADEYSLSMQMPGGGTAKWWGVTVQRFTGTQDQEPPAGLVAVWPEYDDALPGLAYVYLKVKAPSSEAQEQAAVDGFPHVVLVVKGRKVYDPRTETTEYSANPALALADYLWTDAGEARGFDGLDWASVAVCADACDEEVNAKPRRTLGLALTSAQPVDSWRETLRAYAGVILYEDDGRVVMVPDRPREVDRVFTADDIIAGSLSLSVKRDSGLPDIVEVAWVQASGEWLDRVTRVEVDSTSRKLLRMHLPGIQDAAEAKREAVRRINFATINNRILSFATFDKAGRPVNPGDVISVTWGGVLNSDLFRVMAVGHPAAGQWTIQAESYHSSAYTDAVVEEPDWSVSELADPNSPPTPTGLTLTEEVFEQTPGVWASRIRAEWTDMAGSYPFLSRYLIRLIQVSDGYILWNWLSYKKTCGC